MEILIAERNDRGEDEVRTQRNGTIEQVVVTERNVMEIPERLHP